MPAAAHRRRMSPGCQRFTLRAWWRTISIIDSIGLVPITVLSSEPETPSRVMVSVSARCLGPAKPGRMSQVLLGQVRVGHAAARLAMWSISVWSLSNARWSGPGWSGSLISARPVRMRRL